MSDIMEGLGTATEGGLFAHALEPESGAKKPHPDQPDHCLNCGTELTGAYCQACGQPGHVHRTIGAFMHDLLHGALHFEGKLWRTLPMLFLRPGQLTRRYIEGERARFVSPMALFLFAVFLMFAVFQIVGITAPTQVGGEETVETALAEVQVTAVEELADIDDQLSDTEITAEQRTELEDRKSLLELIVNQDAGDASSWAGFGSEVATEPSAEEEVTAEAETGEFDLRDIPISGGTGVEFLDQIGKKWRDNPGLMVYKLQANAYKFSWLLIPISIPFVWLLFAWRRRFKAYDHAIFVTYSLSFMTILFIVASVLPYIGVPSSLITLGVLVIPPIHIYKQLRYAYEIGRFSAFWRLMALSSFIWIIVALFVNLLLLIGAF